MPMADGLSQITQRFFITDDTFPTQTRVFYAFIISAQITKTVLKSAKLKLMETNCVKTHN